MRGFKACSSQEVHYNCLAGQLDLYRGVFSIASYGTVLILGHRQEVYTPVNKLYTTV